MRAVVLLLVAACETGGGGETVQVDAAPDATVIPVVALSSCPSSVAGTVTDTPTMFVPKETTIMLHQVVKFVITSEHFVLPNTLVNTDQVLRVDRGETKCFQFNVRATFGFLCGAHGFTGTITVQ